MMARTLVNTTHNREGTKEYRSPAHGFRISASGRFVPDACVLGVYQVYPITSLYESYSELHTKPKQRVEGI